ANDALNAFYTIYLGRQELRKRWRESARLRAEATRDGIQPVEDEPWRWTRLVTPTSVLRGIWDFIVPVIIAIYAIVMLYSAIHTVAQGKTPPTLPREITLHPSPLQATLPAVSNADTTLLYILSTLAQTCAALAAFVGAVGLFRLQVLLGRHRAAERDVRGWTQLATGHDYSQIPMEEVLKRIEESEKAGNQSPHLKTAKEART